MDNNRLLVPGHLGLDRLRRLGWAGMDMRLRTWFRRLHRLVRLIMVDRILVCRRRPGCKA
jgi:hypothetical protein